MFWREIRSNRHYSQLTSGAAAALRKYRHFLARGQRSAEANLFEGGLSNPKFVFIFRVVNVMAHLVILVYVQKYLII